MDRSNLDASFYDDSSNALGLGHSSFRTDYVAASEAEVAEMRRRILDSGAVDWIIEHLKSHDDGRGLQPADRVSLAYQRFQEMGTDAVRVRVKEHVEVNGLSLQDAMQLAAGAVAKADRITVVEFGQQGEDDTTPDEVGPWSEGKVTALMRSPVRPSGSGSRSGKKNKKPKKDGRGRPYVEFDEPRDNSRSIYMTASTKEELDKLSKDGIGPSDVMAMVARAILEGKTLAQIVGSDILGEVLRRTPISTPQNPPAA